MFLSFRGIATHKLAAAYVASDDGARTDNRLIPDRNSRQDNCSCAKEGVIPHRNTTRQGYPRADECMGPDRAVMIDACPGIDDDIGFNTDPALKDGPGHDLPALADGYFPTDKGEGMPDGEKSEAVLFPRLEQSSARSVVRTRTDTIDENEVVRNCLLQPRIVANDGHIENTHADGFPRVDYPIHIDATRMQRIKKDSAVPSGRQ